MKSASDINHAAAKAGHAARRALRVALACALVLGGAGAVHAQQYGQYGQYGPDRQYGERRDDPSMQQNGRGRFQLPPQDRDQRQADARAYEEQQRRQYQQQEQQRDPRRNGGRMTPDERRDLRRQINEAGMDLYPPRR